MSFHYYGHYSLAHTSLAHQNLARAAAMSRHGHVYNVARVSEPPLCREVLVLGRRKRRRNGRVQGMDISLEPVEAASSAASRAGAAAVAWREQLSSSGGGPSAWRDQLSSLLAGGEPVYGPGDELSGVVGVCCTDTIRFRSLAVRLKAFVKIRWSKKEAICWRDSYSEEITYIDERKYLLGGHGSGARQRLPEGRHEYRFRFRLPDNPELATSFESDSGMIRYQLRAELDESVGLVYKTTKPFTFISPVDLHDRMYRAPIKIAKELSLPRYFLRSAGNICADISTDKTGYIPGDHLVLSGHFSNISSKSVRPEASLCQFQTLQCGPSSQKKKCRSSVLLVGDLIPSGRDGHWEQKRCRLPLFGPTVLNCRLIKVEYVIEVSFCSVGQPRSEVISLPIVLGSIEDEHYEAGDDDAAEASDDPDEDDPVETTTTTTTTPRTLNNQLSLVEDDQPPSYIECVTFSADQTTEAAEVTATTSEADGERSADKPPEYSQLEIGEKNSQGK